ncbi:hypothetical protein NQZ68_009373 [Dissostichus eleginoides]|nr:hypothetical protein NQZ68_009373 [Dissostichus eleginoides]
MGSKYQHLGCMLQLVHRQHRLAWQAREREEVSEGEKKRELTHCDSVSDITRLNALIVGED